MKASFYLSQIAGISIYPIISLAIFLIFFGIVSFWAYRISKSEIERYERMPLDK